MFEFNAPDNFLKDKTIMVTGASDGIGKVCAKTYAEYGAKVIMLGRNQEKLEAVFDEIEDQHPGRAFIHPLDFSTATLEDYKLLANSVNEQFQHLDGLIHNAALLGARTPIEFYPEKDWTELMQVNVNAPFFLSKALLPALARSEDSRVLFISSSVGRTARAYWGAYGVSKFAIEGLMQTLAEEVAKTTKIKVNSLNPGGTKTKMRRDAFPAEDPDSQPLPEELMPVYLYLMSTESRSIHGQALNVRDFLGK